MEKIILENCKNLNDLTNLTNDINIKFIKSKEFLSNLKIEKKEITKTKSQIFLKKQKQDLVIKNKAEKIKKFEEKIKKLEKDAKNMEILLNNLMKKKVNPKTLVKNKLQQKKDKQGFDKKTEFESLIKIIGKISLPIDGKIIVNFGQNKYSEYSTYYSSNGIQIKSKDKILVRNVFKGKVVFCNNFDSYGKTVILEHENDIFTVYAYLDEYFVKMNQDVLVGDILGKVNKNEKILYFEVRYKNEKIDPKIWIKNF